MVGAPANVGQTDKKLIEEYQGQVADLREKLDGMENTLRQKEDELNNAMDGERTRSTAASMEFSDLRSNLEDKLADALSLNESLQNELGKLRSDQTNTERGLRQELDDLRASGAAASGVRSGNDELETENAELRMELEEQQKITEEVRVEALESLREMRILSETSGSSWEREEQLSKQVCMLEEEVKDWRNRYARTKTQLRTLRASSIGLSIEQNAGRDVKDGGFTQSDGLVKDVHVTKFQIAIDELLRTARSDDPARTIDFMKTVVFAIRNITQDIDSASTANEELAQQQAKLKSRVSATANNLITASKNYVSASGLSPVSLLDAAASHLTCAVVDLIRTVKIRPTPAGELEDDDDGSLPARDPTGFFPAREERNDLPPFFGLRAGRISGDSSMYSPVNSPRESSAPRPRSSGRDWRRSGSRGGFANGSNGVTSNLSAAPAMTMGFGIRTQESDVEELKVNLSQWSLSRGSN